MKETVSRSDFPIKCCFCGVEITHLSLHLIDKFYIVLGCSITDYYCSDCYDSIFLNKRF